MKRWVSICLVFLLAGGLFLCNVNQNVMAGKITPPAQTPSPIAGGSWSAGSEVDVDLSGAPVPSWLELLTKGVKVTAPGQICHSFRGGQYHWVGEIRMLKDGKWVKVETTNDWVPSKEGTFMSCAAASQPGIYALFGYYDGPYEYPTAVPTELK